MGNMQNLKLVVGYIQFIDLETGFWQISEDNEKYRLVDIPEELKHENLRIAAIIEIIEEETSIFISGKSAKILEYKIIK